MKQAITWAVVVVLLVVGGYYLFRSNDSESINNENTSGNNVDNSNNSNTSNNNVNTVGMKSTLGGIFDEPGSYQCNYEQVTPQVRSTNVVYISAGKLRGEFRSTTATASTLSMVIYDGSNLFVWNEGQTTGKISQPRTIKDLPSLIPEDVTSGRILGSSANNVSWDCHAWSKVPSMLTRPSYVKFN
ncbi:MAG TPA: hypothetical protein VGC58_00665 [Candidatus Paceibacterota bacterium]